MAALSVALFHTFSGGLLTVEAVASSAFILEVVVPYVLYLVFVSALVAVTFIDLDWFVIPDIISLPGIPLGLCVTAVAGDALGITLQDAVIGALAGGGVLWIVGFSYTLLRGRTGLGGADWKILAMAGAWLGWQALPAMLLLSSLQGILCALVFSAIGHFWPQARFAIDPSEMPEIPGVEFDESDKEPPATWQGQLAIPFGPFLALAAMEILYLRVEIDALFATWLDFGP